MKNIILARHGRSKDDDTGRYGGWHDDRLTETGRAQAARLAGRLQRKPIDVLGASVLSRAWETAEIIYDGLLMEGDILKLEVFKECNRYGVLSGLNKKEADEQYPGQRELLEDRNLTVLGAEPYAEFKPRILGAMADLVTREEACIAVVTHGGPIRVVYREILGLGEIKVDDCAYVELGYENGGYSLIESDGITLLAA